MIYLEELKNKIYSGGSISKSEALTLCDIKLDDLCGAANEIRLHFCKNTFDICTIVNGKNGNCSENCKFCAQSRHSNMSTIAYPLLSCDELLASAKNNHSQGVLRYSIVTSGRKLSDNEVDDMCVTISKIRLEVGILVCTSFGLLDEKQYRKLKAAGVSCIHNNLETSKNFFSNICTTHTFEDKVNAIKAAQSAGLSVCSGGIMGLGETMEDRIDMAISLRKLGIKSVPINMLNPIPKTPLEHHKKLTIEDMRRIVAIYRFILPKSSIRLAGGRGLLADKGESCFLSGANAAISGDMLTTSGITVKTDMELISKMGYKIGLYDE